MTAAGTHVLTSEVQRASDAQLVDRRRDAGSQRRTNRRPGERSLLIVEESLSALSGMTEDPAEIDGPPAVMYVSIVYRTTGHLCCCGCPEEVIAPLAPAQWALTYDGDTVSLNRSIGNWTLPCQSHYVIRRNQVPTQRRFTPDEIIDNQARDRAALNRYDIVGADPVDVDTPANTAASVTARRTKARWWTRLLYGRPGQ